MVKRSVSSRGRNAFLDLFGCEYVTEKGNNLSEDQLSVRTLYESNEMYD